MKEAQRILPSYTIAGTEFTVDVFNEELRQTDQPGNVIGFDQMAYSKNGYRFDYNTELKNIPISFVGGYETVHVPNMTELDPVGMAAKYNMDITEIAGKTDIDIMVDQKQLALREGGQLPVIEIAGHPFYVDLAMDALRPKDDFTTPGIRFSEIDDYFFEGSRHYRIPHNPKTHTLEELDFENIKAIPKGIILVEIPLPHELDPVAYARIHGLDRDQILREHPIQMNTKAIEIPWADTPLKQIIARNLKRELEKNQAAENNKPQRKRGRRL